MNASTRLAAVLFTLPLLTSACGDDGGADSSRDASRGDALVADAQRTDDARPDGSPRPDIPWTADAEPTDATSDAGPARDQGPPLLDPIRINELQPKNGGTWVDELGALEDWIELVNASDVPVSLAGYSLSDRADKTIELPEDSSLVLPARGAMILFADNAPEEGPRHLPFKLSADGEQVVLRNPAGVIVDEVEFPALAENHSYARHPDARGAFDDCEWPTPLGANGAQCGAPPPPQLPDDMVFAPYDWPDPWPQPPRPLILTELSLRPAAGEGAFVEILNASDAAVALAGWHLGVAVHAPGLPSPGPADGVHVSLDAGQASLPAGGRLVLDLPGPALATLQASPEFEGVVTLFSADRDLALDRVDFMAWPAGAALARDPDATGRHRFCARTTRGAANDACDPLTERPITDHVRHLRTPGDFARLARGGSSVGVEQVKWMIDLEAGGTVYFLDTEHWDLHYTFVRERIEHQPHLDRCDPAENQVFYDGWYRFSEQNYFQVEGRRFLMGSLVHHASANLYTVEFTPGDRISADQMRLAFLAVLSHVDAPTRFSLRPTEARQFARIAELEGRLPLVGMNAPFRDVTYQPLTEAVGYGVLTYLRAPELESAALGEQVLVITDQVPNDIPLVGGLITEAFQTPLAHVNLLSRNRGTPNMALRGAHDDPRIAPHLGTLVRLTVAAGGFEIVPAEPEEALAFWESRRASGEPLRPRADLSLRGVVPLNGRRFADLPALGGKAAQFAELYRVNSQRAACVGPLNVPVDAAAVPVVHSLEHFQASGAEALLARHQAEPEFRSDPHVRGDALAEVRAAILQHPVDPALLADVTAYVTDHFGDASARFRSSSNTEDLPGFNGAGLYTSVSASAADPDEPIDDALRTVWASLWNLRGYDERAFNNVAQEAVAMGVLIHPAFPTERANGVAISRNILEPLYRNHYINSQIGEASVTNPVAGVASEQVIYHGGNDPFLEYLGRSSLTRGAPVMTLDEVGGLSCRLAAIHDHLRPLLDPQSENRWFAVDIEFKLLGDDHTLLIKQARQYSFGHADIPTDCREF